MRSYLTRKMEGVLFVVGTPQQRADSTWTTIIAVWFFAVFCAYAVIGLLLAGWILLG